MRIEMATKKELTKQLKKLDITLRVLETEQNKLLTALSDALWRKRFRLQGKIIKATMEASEED
jgi:hypothetical protein